MKLSFVEPSSSLPNDETLVFLIGEDKKPTGRLAEADKLSGGAVRRALSAGKFAGKKGQFLTLQAPHGLRCQRLIIAGFGTAGKFNTRVAEAIGGGLIAQLNALGATSATVTVDGLKGSKLKLTDAAAHVAVAARLRSYRFDKYRTKEKSEKKPTMKSLTLAVAGSKGAQSAFGELNAVADGVVFARDLVTEPPNVIYPESLAAECKKLSKLGVQVEVLGVKEMTKLGMGALLGVGQGSAKESKLVVMRWNKGKGAPVAFVGKGVTFDTGGISIKPANGMEDMKYDMGGSAAVIGTMYALAARKAKVNAVGVVGLVENMPDGNAQRPSDVVVSMSGQTIEVLNTDAEGRLVLADALWYTQEKFKPRFVVNLATLTGAIVVALGTIHAGIFSNDDKLAKQLKEAGEASGETLWQLPMGEEYDEQINSDIADMQNIGRDREAGSVTAAQFLKRFIQDGTPWAHLDIAGMAWTKKDLDVAPKGARGFGVRLLNELVAANYE